MDCGVNGKPSIALVTSAPIICAISPLKYRDGPPEAILFIPIIDRITTEGSALKPMMATHIPPSSASMSRLRISVA
ncbi:hypothetical protein D3C78_1651070 [compost metagenome]